MKRMTMVLAISVAIFFAACGGPAREARLMSYNVRNLSLIHISEPTRL